MVITCFCLTYMWKWEGGGTIVQKVNLVSSKSSGYGLDDEKCVIRDFGGVQKEVSLHVIYQCSDVGMG